jgi:integrase
MARKGKSDVPGIQLDQHGAFWATLEGEHAKLWRDRYPGRSLPRRKAKDLRQALKLQRQLVDDLKAVRDVNAENPRVAALVRRYIDQNRELAPSTVRRYDQSLAWQIAPNEIGRMRIQQVLKKQVEEWIDVLEVQKRQDDDTRTLAANTIDRAFALLRAAFNMAVEEGLLVKNPCTGVRLPRPDDEEVEPLTPEQVDTFLSLVDSLDRGRPHRNAALYHIAIRCGLRQGELIGLRWKDVDLGRRELRVSSQLQRGERIRPKRNARRALPLTSDLVRVLTWHKQNQAEERNVSADGWNAAGLVFCSERGTPISPRNLDRQFKALLKRAGLPNIRFHDLRHTYATLSIAAGVDVFTLSRRMGHSGIGVTSDRYGHLYQAQTQDADALDRLLRRAK